MLEIIEDGGIPLVRVKPCAAEVDSDIVFEIVPAGPDTKYVAYSHVWADGRGNVHTNSLFKCQWRWLQECAQRCQTDSIMSSASPGEIVPFWINTFCVPRGSGQRVAELRTKSISMMPEIYRGPDIVLVLDRALENAGHMSLLEFGMRLKFCSWSRRVWTLHEGAVADNLYFRMALGLVGLRQNYYTMVRAKYPLRGENGWAILQGIEKEYIHAVFQSCLMINRFKASPRATFFLTWKELQKRSTSLPNDRYLVLGIINQVSKETLLRLQRTTLDKSDPDAAAQAKMKLILLNTPVIPQSIVFTTDERFSEPGMQWALCKIGGQILQMDDHLTDGPRYVPGKGVLVKYKGWRIQTSVHDMVPSCFMYLKLEGTNAYPNRYKLGIWQTDERRKSFANLLPSLDPNAALSIVLGYLPDLEDSFMAYQLALLVEELGKISTGLSEGTETHSVIHVRFVAVLRLYSTRDGQESPSDLRASWVNDGLEQLWCVG